MSSLVVDPKRKIKIKEKAKGKIYNVCKIILFIFVIPHITTWRSSTQPDRTNNYPCYDKWQQWNYCETRLARGMKWDFS